MSTCFYVSTLTITSSKPENVCLSHTRKEAQRGWMPDLRPHSKLTGHWDLNLGPESGVQSPSIQQRPKHSHPPLCGMWRTSSRNAVTRTVWEFELSPPQPAAWLVLLAPGRLAPSPHCRALCPWTSSFPSLCLLLGGLRTLEVGDIKSLSGAFILQLVLRADGGRSMRRGGWGGFRQEAIKNIADFLPRG